MDNLQTIYSLPQEAEKNDLSLFENLYNKIREKEERIYSDEQLAMLPSIHQNHPHFGEWKIREHSSKQILRYLKNLDRELNILEVGCGNGWLSAAIAGITQGNVTGIDINRSELEQAMRVFGKKDNLRFLYGDIRSGFLNDEVYDTIVFAASIQYFPSLTDILNAALKHLSPGGEIHLMDSHLYKKNELPSAKLRTREYYETLGYPEMTMHYFHHCIEDLSSFNYKILYNPSFIHRRLLGNKSPFYHICIKA